MFDKSNRPRGPLSSSGKSSAVCTLAGRPSSVKARGRLAVLSGLARSSTPGFCGFPHFEPKRGCVRQCLVGSFSENTQRF